MKMKDIKEAKENVLLAFAIMLLLFTICIVVYNNKTSSQTNEIQVDTNVSFSGGADALSLELQYIIPFVSVNDPIYTTAYQDRSVVVSDVSNDILLTKGYFNNIGSTTFNMDLLSSKIKDMYGSNIFIVNRDFNVNGKDSCSFIDDTYTCNTLEYTGILYKAIRDIEKLEIYDSSLYLTENILFYSEETIDNVTYYDVYTNGLYETVTKSFNSNDLLEANMTFDEYIVTNLEDCKVKYQSNFIINNDKYNWMGTIMI